MFSQSVCRSKSYSVLTRILDSQLLWQSVTFSQSIDTCVDNGLRINQFALVIHYKLQCCLRYAVTEIVIEAFHDIFL